MNRAALLKDFKLPYKPYIAQGNKVIYRCFKQHEAKQAPYLQIDRGDYKNGGYLRDVMVIDLDTVDLTENDLLNWVDIIPFQPAFFVGKYKTNDFGQQVLHRAHAVIRLTTPINTKSYQQNAWFNQIQEEICARLRSVGSEANQHKGKVVKNPLFSDWDVVQGDNRTWDLRELTDALGDFTYREEAYEDEKMVSYLRKAQERYGSYVPASSDFVIEGRNDELFIELFYKMLPEHDKYSSYEGFYGYVYSECAELNSELFGTPLDEGEFKHIAKSVARFLFYKYEGQGTHKLYKVGAASAYIKEEDSQRKKQQIGAFYGNKEQHKKNYEIVQAAKQAIEEAGGTPTKKGIARDTGLALNTVKKHWEGSPVSPSAEKLRQVTEENVEYLPTARQSAQLDAEKRAAQKEDLDQLKFDFLRGQNAPIRIGEALANPKSENNPPTNLVELVSTHLQAGEVFEQLSSSVSEYSDSKICDLDFSENRGGQNAIDELEEGGQNSLPGTLNADFENFLNTGSELEDLLGSLLDDQDDWNEE